MDNSIEIDFLPVGNGEKSGDAIAFRFGDFSDPSSYYVVVIDGGTAESGKALVEHIKKYYDSFVNLVISTHPDGDHSSGLREVLCNLQVGELWMHRPWNHSKEILELFKDGRITNNSLSERLQNAYNIAYDLEQIAKTRNIPIKEPFEGLTFAKGFIRILGPSENYYNSLLPEFTKSPEALNVSSQFYSKMTEDTNWIKETMQIETLSNEGKTSAENNSSVVILLDFNNLKYLFTGDVGIEGMKNVIEYTNGNGIDISKLKVFQVPHHGSHRNITPSILNSFKCEYAYVSASKDAPKHPSKKVVNALIRRNASVFSTAGKLLNYHDNCYCREGYYAARDLDFFDKVEE